MKATFSCTTEFFDFLKKLKEETGLSKSKIIELAVKEWSIKWLKK